MSTLIKNTTRRSLYYYELSFNLYSNFQNTEHAYIKCLNYVNKLVKDKSRDRYLIRENDTILFGRLDFMPEKKYIKGILYKVRNDIFPQLIDMNNEDISDLNAKEEQGILEITHFLIDYRNKNKAKLLIEYNHYGARITEFAKYFSYLGRQTKIIKRVEVTPIVRDRLESIATRVNKVSKFTVKVHKDNISRIQEQDEGLGTALYHARNFSLSDYIEIDLKFDYKERQETRKIYESVMTWVRRFITNPDEAENFELLKIEAEDE